MSEEPVLISLGYNCEVSFRLEDYFGGLDSYLFSWSYEEDRELFLKALKNTDDVFSGNVSLRDDHMFADETYKIKFHPRYDILSKSGAYTQKNYDEALSELQSRIKHLKEKTKELFASGRKVIFLVKVQDFGEEKNIKYIKALSNVLKEVVISGNFLLVAVLEKKNITKKISELEDSILRIRTVKKFAPVKHTDIWGDVKGWYKILFEFSQNDGRCYFKNVRDRRVKIIPKMIIGKIRRIFKK